MKISIPLFLAMIASQGASANNQRTAGGRRLEKFTKLCTAVLVDVQYQPNAVVDPGEQRYLACLTDDGNAYKVRAANQNFLNDNFENGAFISGETDLTFGDDAVLDSVSNEILSKIPPVLAKKSWESGRKLAVTNGQRSVLVVRVITSNYDDSTYDETSATATSLSNSVFGNGVDLVNLSSQYAACSHKKLEFIKAADKDGATNSITNGVVTVTVNTASTDKDITMRNAITAKLNSDFNVSNPNQLANHVMYCLPTGTMSGIAYAYVNSWNSVYSDNWCTYVSAQMHEIGHNLNMAHSNEGATTYADQSGMMGYSYSKSDTPVMCFNSAKSWQFGWYDQRHKTVDANSNRAYKGKLVSILDDPNDSTGAPMLIKIETGTNADYFINFNRKTGFNSGTVEGGNQVLITVAGNGNNYVASNLKAKLSVGKTWSATVGTETVTVKVNLINLSNNGFANVDICFGQCPNVDTPGPTAVSTTSPSKRPTAVPTTKAPTTSPSKRPTAVPTTFPTKKPTTSPVTSPPPFDCSTITSRKVCRNTQLCSWNGKCSNK